MIPDRACAKLKDQGPFCFCVTFMIFLHPGFKCFRKAGQTLWLTGQPCVKCAQYPNTAVSLSAHNSASSCTLSSHVQDIRIYWQQMSVGRSCIKVSTESCQSNSPVCKNSPNLWKKEAFRHILCQLIQMWPSFVSLSKKAPMPINSESNTAHRFASIHDCKLFIVKNDFTHWK